MTHPTDQAPWHEEVARELHTNGVHTKCPPDCQARWDASGTDAAPVAPAPVAPSRRKPLLIAAGVLVAGLATAATLLLTSGPTMHPLTIDVALLDADSGCSGGAGGYSDIGPGQPVTVKDENGKILASTVLPDTGGGSFGCVWTMHVVVPDNAQQYGVEMGRRGTVTFSHDKLVADHWKAELSIGGN
ncbi:MAG: putative rane protein [Frankiales bacterium]|nr:putative rane protein [Frankiales bacterium]